MSRPRSDMLTEREAQIMEVLWSHGGATAEQVRALLPGQPHDSTVRTLLKILETKGYVAREGSRPLAYRAVISRARAQQTALLRLLRRFFSGSPEALALRLLEDRHLTPEQLAEIAQNMDNEPNNASTPAPSSPRRSRKSRTHEPKKQDRGGRP